MSRSQLNVAVVAILAGALLAGYVALWSSVSRADMGASDFVASYVGGTLLREGHRSDLYSDPVQAPLHATLVGRPHSANLAFVNPPTAALIMVPVSLLPFAVAYRLWQVLQVLMLVAAGLIAMRATPWGVGATRARAPAVAALVGVAGTGTLALGLLAQWDGLSALGLAGAYALWRSDRRLAGGLLLAVSAAGAKPHLALGLAAFLVGWRERRVIAGAAAGLFGVLLTWLLIVGPAGLAGLGTATVADATRWPLASMLGFTGLTGSWLGNGAIAAETALLGSAIAVGLCVVLGARHRQGGDLEPCLAAATLLSLLASPHLLSHDLVLLAPMLVVMLGWASRHDPSGSWPGQRSRAILGGWALLCLAAAIDLGSQQPAPPGRLVPLVLAGLAGGVAWQVRRRRPRPQPALATT